jgi:hypothetical protein
MGGAGGCHFEGELREGDVIQPVTLKLMQQLPGSKVAAEEIFQSVKRGMADSHKLSVIADLGTQAFAFSALDTKVDWNIWVQQNDTILHTQLLGPGDSVLTDKERNALQTLTASAVRKSQSPAVKAQAQDCPHFEPALLAKLFPGAAPTVQQFGENSCMAQNEKPDVVMISLVPSDSKMLEMMRQGAVADCSVEDVADLEMGFVTYDCKSGNPHVSIRFMHQDQFIDLNYVPAERSPTPDEREHLIALAQWIAR